MKNKTILPVSRKFLARIRSRVSDVLVSLGKTDTDFIEHIMATIHAYLDGTLPDLPTATDDRYCCHLIFLTLRAEIDAAVLRSRRARESARRRAEIRRQSADVTPSREAPAPLAAGVTDGTPEVDEKEMERQWCIAYLNEKKRKYEEAKIVETLPNGDTRITYPDGRVILQ